MAESIPPLSSIRRRRISLPAIYAQDPVMQELADRVEALLSEASDALERLPSLLEAWQTDPAWLAWLREISGAPGSVNWPLDSQRAAIERAPALVAGRGTRNALDSAAALLGWELSVADPGEASTLSAAGFGRRRSLVAGLAWDPSQVLSLPSARVRLTQLVKDHCPAHLPCEGVVTSGSPRTALARPEQSGSRAQILFVYGSGRDEEVEKALDEAVAYDPAVPAPLEGRHRIADHWANFPPGILPDDHLKDFTLDAVIGATRDPRPGSEGSFWVFTEAKAWYWQAHDDIQGFQVPIALHDLFPPPKEDSLVNTAPDDAVTVSGAKDPNRNGVYVFIRNRYRCYDFEPKAAKGTLKSEGEISALVNRLPPFFTQDLDSAVEDPRDPSVFYLLSGPECARVKDFEFVSRHMIRDLWPGLPVRTSYATTGGGKIKPVNELIPIGHAVGVSYYTHRPQAAGVISLCNGPIQDVAPSRLTKVLQPVKVTAQDGEVTFAPDKLSNPGVHSLYYADMAFDISLAEPAEFTAILDKSQYGTLHLAGTDPVMAPRENPDFSVTTEYANDHNQLIIYTDHGSGPKTQEKPPHALRTARCLVLPAEKNQTFTDKHAYYPGGYQAFLVAPGGLAWLANPLDFTLVLKPNQYGNLTGQGDGYLPALNPILTYQSQEGTYADRRIELFKGQPKDQDNHLPDEKQRLHVIDLVSTQTTDSGVAHIAPDPGQPLTAGGYTAYFLAGLTGTAWASKPLHFTVKTSTPGTLTLTSQESTQGTPIVLSSSYKGTPDDKIFIFKGASAPPPKINTAAESWTGRITIKDLSNSGTVTLEYTDLTQPSQTAERDPQLAGPVAPGPYTAYHLGNSGGILTNPQGFIATLPPDKYGHLTISNPQTGNPLPATDITFSYETKYPDPGNAVKIFPGQHSPKPDQSPEAPEEPTILPAIKSTETVKTQLPPRGYTAYFQARGSRAWLATPVPFTVEAPDSGKLSLPGLSGGTTSVEGNTIQVHYETPHQHTGNWIGIFATTTPAPTANTAPQQTNPLAQHSATKDTETVDIPVNKIPPGDYMIYLLGDSCGKLAPPITLKIEKRTIAFTVDSDTLDSWELDSTLTNQLSTRCTTGTATAIIKKMAPQTIVFTSTGPESPMTATLVFKHKEYNQPLKITAVMDSSGTVTYSTSDLPHGLKAEFQPATTKPNNAYAASDDGGGFHSCMHVTLGNTTHRTVNITAHNTLPAALVPRIDSTKTGNCIASTPEQVKTGELKTISTVATDSDQPMTCSVTYEYTTENKVHAVTVAWASTPGHTKPTYTITTEPEMKVVMDQTMWQTLSPETH
ncbi:hypothetical protein [Streptomyces vinaceus]|uniref:hypothetical protein n=1 Tax=Streptomyces vinaceus TaxID=1960 RepID=UPI0036973722